MAKKVNISSLPDPKEIDKRPDSIGKAIPHAEVFVINKKGKEVPPKNKNEKKINCRFDVLGSVFVLNNLEK